MAAVLHHSQAKATDKLILLGIANHDGDGGAWPTLDTLARYGNCSRSKVKQAITRLVELGELAVEVNRGGNDDTRADRRPNRYRVLVRCPLTCDGSTAHRDGGHPSVPRDEHGGHFLDARGSLSAVTGVTGVAPNHPLEPSLEPSLFGDAAAPPETPGQQANRLTKAYTDLVPLSNFPAVAGVVRKALRSGYGEQAITEALIRMGMDGRSVTTDSLRYELDGLPQRRASAASLYLDAASALASDDPWMDRRAIEGAAS